MASIKTPFRVSTHLRKFASITSLKNKQNALGIGATLTNAGSVLMAHNGISVAPVAGYFGPIVGKVSTATANAFTLTPQMSGGMALFDNAAGGVITLPAPQVGLWYQFVVTVAVTSNNYKIITDVPGTTLFIGSLWETIAAGTGTSFFPNGSSHSAVTMAGTTTGGLINTAIDVFCVDATHWLIDGTVMASGTVATPFSNS